MKKILLIISPFFLTITYWLYDGARFSFWATSIEIREEIPVVDGMPELGTQTKVVWIDKFLCGIETPIIGLILSISILIAHLCKKMCKKCQSVE